MQDQYFYYKCVGSSMVDLTWMIFLMTDTGFDITR